MAATATEPSVAWAAQPGSQKLFLACPLPEVLLHGTRGPGKTDALLMDFAADVGQGLGSAWRGIVFRQESTQLDEVRAKAQTWFPRIFGGGAKYVGQPKDKWVWDTGEELMFRHARVVKDYWKYHGWEIPWLGFEELTSWPSLEIYHLLKSICRSSHPDAARIARIRATTNPWGPGHNVVKAYFIDVTPELHAYEGEAIEVDDMTIPGLERTHIHGHYSENRALMDAQPDYASRIAASAPNPEARKAWLTGSWDIVAGGMFDDLWNASVHVIPDWLDSGGKLAVPSSWRIDRSYDWGSSKPFSVGWWAESDGTTAPNGRTYPRGTLFRIAEWYGWNESPNQGIRMTDREVAAGIVQREQRLGIRERVKPGPADSMIFNVDAEGASIADTMRAHGVKFTQADKRPGSRRNGWEAIRRRLKASSEHPMEDPGLFVFASCRQSIRTIPVLPRDDRDPDDVDTDAEDHVGDEWRYRCLAAKPSRIRSDRKLQMI